MAEHRPEQQEPEVRIEPVRELVIKEALFFSSVDELAKFANIAAGGRPTGIYWAEGCLLYTSPSPRD